MAHTPAPAFRVLGPVALGNGEAPPLGGRKQRALLAYLLLHAGEPVGTGQLVDAIWGERPPATAPAVVYAYVRKLRTALEGLPAELLRDAAGYRIVLPDEELDLHRFEHLAREGKSALRAGEAAAAAQLLEEALGLWRGPPLLELEGEPSGDAARTRLEQVRLDASIDRVEAELALGRHEQVVPELSQLVAENPYEERLRAPLILALYRSGRQADALAAYREARNVLHDELGLEPSAELRALQQAILRQDPELAPPRGAPAPAAAPTRRRRWPLVAAVASGLVLLVAVVVGFALGGSSRKQVAVAPNSVAVLDPRSGAVVADVPVGTDPIRVVAGAGAVWAINHDDQTLTRIDPRTLRTRTIGLAASPEGLAVGAGAVWVGNGDAGSISVIDPNSALVRTLLRLGNEIDDGRRVVRYAPAVVADGRSAWTAVGLNPPRVLQIDRSGMVRRRTVDGLPGPDGPNALAVAHDVAWSLAPGVLIRADLRRHTTAAIPVGAPVPSVFGGSPLPAGLAVGAGGIWATNPYEGILEDVSPETGEQLATVHVPGRPTSVAVGGGTVWAAGLDGDVSAVDGTAARVRRTMHVAHPTTGVAVGYGRVWVSVGS